MICSKCGKVIPPWNRKVKIYSFNPYKERIIWKCECGHKEVIKPASSER